MKLSVGGDRALCLPHVPDGLPQEFELLLCHGFLPWCQEVYASGDVLYHIDPNVLGNFPLAYEFLFRSQIRELPYLIRLGHGDVSFILSADV